MVTAIVRRDYEILRSYRASFVLEVVLGLMSIFIFYFVGQTFKGTHPAGLDGAQDYFSFAVVGVSITTVMLAASTGLARRLRDEQLTGTLEALVVQPASTTEISLGLIGYPFTVATFRAVIYLLIADVVLGVNFDHASWPGFLVAMLVAASAISGVGLIVGAAVLVLKRAEVVTGLVVFGLALAGGAYFPRSVLPEWLEVISDFAPTRFVYDAVRHALYRGHDWLAPTGVLALFSIVGLPLGAWLFDRALRFSRARGSLTQY